MGEGGLVGVRRGRIDTLHKHEIHKSDLAKRLNIEIHIIYFNLPTFVASLMIYLVSFTLERDRNFSKASLHIPLCNGRLKSFLMVKII